MYTSDVCIQKQSAVSLYIRIPSLRSSTQVLFLRRVSHIRFLQVFFFLYFGFHSLTTIFRWVMVCYTDDSAVENKVRKRESFRSFDRTRLTIFCMWQRCQHLVYAGRKLNDNNNFRDPIWCNWNSVRVPYVAKSGWICQLKLKRFSMQHENTHSCDVRKSQCESHLCYQRYFFNIVIVAIGQSTFKSNPSDFRLSHSFEINWIRFKNLDSRIADTYPSSWLAC